MKINYNIHFFWLLLFSFWGVTSQPLFAQTETSREDSLKQLWADSVLQSLSLDEKIAQMMMIRTYSNKDSDHYNSIKNIISKYNIGGLCFFQGGPIQQAKLTNRYQEITKTPLLIALDAEWGVGMRLDSAFSFPYQMTLGATSNDNLIYGMGAEIARQLKLLGVHINFAPVVDINNNPNNPVINSRSFGEDRNSVATKGIAYMKGLQDNGIIATAKHFPGHGDTDSDSHYTLPIINHSAERLDSIELFPFKKLINAGLDGVMVAHLFVPQLDDSENTPTTLSKPVVTDLLKKKLEFEGLVITDALDMKGVTSHYKPGEIEVKAIMAGNDILLLPQNVEIAIQKIKEAIENGLIEEETINQRCAKILQYKYKAGLNNFQPAQTDSLYYKINTPINELISRKIYESAITIIRNEKEFIPLREFDTLQIATVSVGSPQLNSFQQMLSKYHKVEHFNLLKSFSPAKEEFILKKLSSKNLVIASIHGTNIYPKENFGISKQSLQFIERIADSTHVILVVFANPYSLASIENPEKFATIIAGYQDNRISNEIAAQIIMGGIDGSGKLPVSADKKFIAGNGLTVESIKRLKYTIPEEVGISSKHLEKIDSIALYNIRQKATPGCQILVAKEGKVIYQKSFGYHTYSKSNFVKNDDLYDLASLTKIAATTLSVMKLSDEKKLDIDHKLVWYLPYLRGTNKEDIIIREMMAHQARLKAWIPFYIFTMENGKPIKDIYSRNLNMDHTVIVANHLYIKDGYKYILFDSITTSELRKNNKYKYSDLGFYYLKQLTENLTNQPMEDYVDESFYKPLGLQTMGYLPLERFQKSSIVPTEVDDYFRNQLIHGYVHDPGAAMLGGVSGHAGLFSNANDLAVIMQMLLQGGEYGGKRYINYSTVQQFTKQQFPLNKNRRGIGFDKPDPNDYREGPTIEDVSLSSFGHTGFTGIYAWVDPEYELVYIFLSNRIHPTARNTKLLKYKTRLQIQQVIYDALPKLSQPEEVKTELGILTN